jgi:Fe-S oxidoreductase
MMMRREYPELLDVADRERAAQLSAAVMDVSEFLWSIRNEERFNTQFKSMPGEKVAYHAPCHLRAQAVGFKGRDLLRKIPGVKPVAVIECCGHNGTYAMTVEGFEPSARLGQKVFDGMKAAGAEVWASDCPLAAVQLEQHAGRRALHPMTILARAYREDGFPKRVQQESSP